MDEEQALEALSNVISALSETPFDLSLHEQHIQLALATGMNDQMRAARETLTAYYACADDVWLPLIEDTKTTADLETVDGALSVLAVYKRAEDDYLSIPLLRQHIDFLTDRYSHFSSDTKPILPDDPFSTEWTREALRVVVAQGVNHITQGYLLWDALRDWELENLSTVLLDERSAAIVEIEDMYLKRLQQCYSTNEETFQSYSTFTTNYKAPQAYETLLVNASKIRGRAKKAYDWREPYEVALEQSGNSLYAYQNYVTYELRAKRPDLDILSNIHERAIAEAAKRRASSEVGAEEALRLWWASYVDSMRRNDAPLEQQLSLFRRSVRSVPRSGEQWAKYIRFLEVNSELVEEGKAEPVSVVYDKAFATKLFEKDVEGMVSLFLARAGFERRICFASLENEQSDTESSPAESAVAQPFLEPQDRLSTLLDILNNGIKATRSATKGGDSRFRLERFLFTLLSDLGQPGDAAKVWADAGKHLKNAYIPWLEYTSALEHQNEHEEARKAFEKVSKTQLDWPEMLWEAWLSFEHSHGSVTEIQNALDVVERARTLVESRRAKEAERAGYQAMQVTTEQQADVPVTGATREIETPMDVDSGAKDTGSGVKRKAEEEPSEESKKARVEQPQTLKRDREKCTVFVGGLPSETTDDDLAKLFKDCGDIREVKITQLPNMHTATVEFVARDSVPAALTKDKKRVHNHEINVHLAWESTLYVTNFPESANDNSVRKLFGQYGHIFDVRWPSKKFKSTRRFCYVQYTSPTAAKLALELHGRELEPGHSLNVYISNPERKKERTDADANAREVYVAGLSKFVTKVDLEKLFRTYGPVKEIRMALDADNHSKGFAFVEFDEEVDASRALGANNYELKKRRIAVTISDPRVRSRKREPETGFGKKADARNRSLRIRSLPGGTEEGLLQQAIEKLAPVSRLEVFTDKNEATVEFQLAADAARLLLLPDPLEFNGVRLRFSESEETPAKARSAASTAGSGMFIPRTTASRPRAGLGRARNPPPAAAAAGTSSAPEAKSQTSSGDKAPIQGRAQDDFRKMLLGRK